MQKYKYNINNLDCANCAREVEEGLSKDSRLKNVRVNFNTCKLSFESDKDIPIKELNKMVSKIEPEASVGYEETKKEFHIETLIIGIIIFALSYNFKNYIKNILQIISYCILLYKVFINALKILIKSKRIDENMLITISCIGAYIIGESMEGVMVILLYTIGKILETKAINKSRNSIKEISSIKQEFANIGGKKVLVEDIKINDVILVKKGEKVPVDGIVIKGNTKLDTSILTGESKLVNVDINDKVMSGSINMGDIIEVKVTNLFRDSAVSRILELVSEATDKKTHTETFVEKASRIYTPIVILLALIVTIVLPIFGISYSDSIYRGLTFLVISCPCAIAISVPLSYFTGIGTSAKNGILIKGSNYLDNLRNINNVIFDKTGTLTDGSFDIDIKIINKNYTKEEIIEILVKGESLSNHPIAKSIMKLGNYDNSDVLDFKEKEGYGISYRLGDKKIVVGNSKFCKCSFDSLVHLNINKEHVASINIIDGIRKSSYECISNLKKNGIKTYMFTGDKKESAISIGKKLGIEEIKYEMLPQDKYNEYEKINGMTCFVGDGINDTPIIKRADIGVTVGNIDAALEASDVVLISNDLSKLNLAINISKYTNFIIKQNLIFAIATKVIILQLNIVGLTNMWFAVFADTGVTLITILNSLRIMKKYKLK